MRRKIFVLSRWMAAFFMAALLTGLSGCGGQAKKPVSKTVSVAGLEDEITFRSLAMQKEQDCTTVFGEVHNGTGERCSFTVKVSFFNANRKLIGTAEGVVNGLNGGQSRIFTAIAAGNYTNAEACAAGVDAINSIEENEKPPVRFSQITPVTVGTGTRIEGDAQNVSSKKHSFTIVAGFYGANGTLLGVASGAVTDLAPGKTTPFVCFSSGDYANAASYKIFLDTVVE